MAVKDRGHSQRPAWAVLQRKTNIEMVNPSDDVNFFRRGAKGFG